MKLKASTVSKISFIYVIIYGLFSRYIEHYTIWNSILVFLFLTDFLLLNGGKMITKYGMTALLGLFSLLLVVFSAVQGESNRYFNANFQTYLFPAIVCLLILNTVYTGGFKELINWCFIPLNIMWVVNLAVLQLQNLGGGFLIKGEWMRLNSYYEDLCCGLFGMNGTHELCLFAVFIFVYDLYYAELVAKKARKKTIVIYTILTEVYHLIQSTMNDNVSAFIIIPMFFAIFVLLRSQWKNGTISKRIITYFKYALGILIVAVIALNIPSINAFVTSIVVERISNVANINLNKIEGSNERLAIFAYAVTNDWAWKLGKGFGTTGINGSGMGGYLGFSHFGLSNLGSFVVLGGIWVYLIHMLFISKALKDMVVKHRERNRIMLLCLAVMTVLTIYTLPFTSPVLMIWLCLTFSVLGLMKEEYLRARQKG